MPTPFIMPKFDMDQETATVVEWLKAEGERVEADEPVLVVETDKVAVEVPAPAGGTLARISVSAGEVVPVTTVIAYVLADGESTADLPEASAIASQETAQPPEEIIKPQPAGSKAATPVAARMARELGIDLAQVPAEGSRISRDDVARYAAARRPSTPERRVTVAASPAARRLARERQVDLGQVSGSGPGGRVQEADVAGFAQVRGADAGLLADRPAERLPLSGKRRTIAERMTTSFFTAPHIALTVEVEVSSLEATRARLNEVAVENQAAKVSLTALLVRVVAWALARHPEINASLIGDTIYRWQDINVGVATAVPDGLMVPVIRQANRLPVGEISAQLADLTERARSGRLTLDEVHGGTFTISNLGMFGIDHFRAIINPPESAILAVGQVKRKPVAMGEGDQVAVRPMMALTLSADHRVIDGVIAARFLADVVRAAESPDLLLL
jgi:pyruvate dehydrogenase E2 component (dihydrolipoamide acetyltransferase)